MNLTKEDYMRLPKERLAELLVEMQEIPIITTPEPTPLPIRPIEPAPYTPWYPWGPIITYTTNGTKTDEVK